jgi:integrase
LAQDWFAAREREELTGTVRRGSLTVNDCLDVYFKHRASETTKPKSLKAYMLGADARVRPALGGVEAEKLTAPVIRQWLYDIAKSARLVRTSKAATVRSSKPVDLEDPEALRRRRASANNALTILRAALNHCYREGLLPSDAEWRRVRPFSGVDTPVVRFLSEVEVGRLLNACEPDFRLLVHGALMTGARYGELCRMEARDFISESGVVRIRESKSGKPRSVVLTDEGQRLFASLVAGKVGTDLVFTRSTGAPWKASDQARPLAAAAKAAKVDPAPTFHVLRHTHASWLAMRGVPLNVIAAQLGHSDTRITERHYAHLAPSYVADTIRAHFPSVSTGEPSNVVALKR